MYVVCARVYQYIPDLCVECVSFFECVNHRPKHNLSKSITHYEYENPAFLIFHSRKRRYWSWLKYKFSYLSKIYSHEILTTIIIFVYIAEERRICGWCPTPPADWCRVKHGQRMTTPPVYRVLQITSARLGLLYRNYKSYHAHALTHDDVIKWKHFPRYWPFVRGIYRSPANSQHKGQ